uniref:Uncharacterized protein n=1 Tax=Pyxicephalus adspersus TaxID=30357 RepID=A0AAV2ZTE1_PYXAD|nr:TPA: hypothetical protein GDO54_004419 [Pyxicephalus adspersus]
MYMSPCWLRLRSRSAMWHRLIHGSCIQYTLCQVHLKRLDKYGRSRWVKSPLGFERHSGTIKLSGIPCSALSRVLLFLLMKLSNGLNVALILTIHQYSPCRSLDTDAEISPTPPDNCKVSDMEVSSTQKHTDLGTYKDLANTAPGK